MNADQKNNKVKSITSSQFQGEEVILVGYEDGTYKAIFVES